MGEINWFSVVLTAKVSGPQNAGPLDRRVRPEGQKGAPSLEDVRGPRKTTGPRKRRTAARRIAGGACCTSAGGPKGFTQTKDDCGVELAYKWSQGGNGLQHKGFADGLEVSLTDYSMVNAEMKIVTVKAAEIERQKGEQRTGNKAPKL